MTAQPAGSFEWRWVDIGGQQHRVRFDELAQALGRSRLPPHTLVWRAGWLEWVPAANIPELNHALGIGHSGPPFVVRSDPEAHIPPPPPLAHYAMTVPKGTLTLERGADSSVPPPRAPNRGRAAIPVPSEPPPVVGPPVPVRNVMPTLSEDGLPTRSNTLRPMGALPPPPRGAPAPKRPPFSSIPPVGRGSGPPLAPSMRAAPPDAPAKAPPAAPAGAVPRVTPSSPPPRGVPTVPMVPSLHIPNAAPPPRTPARERPAPSNVPSLNIPAGSPLPKGVGDLFNAHGTSSAPPPPSSRRKAPPPPAATPAPPQATATPPPVQVAMPAHAGTPLPGQVAAKPATGQTKPGMPLPAPIGATPAPLPVTSAATAKPPNVVPGATPSTPPPRAADVPHLPSVIVTPHPPPPDPEPGVEARRAVAAPQPEAKKAAAVPPPAAVPDATRSKTKADAPFAKAAAKTTTSSAIAGPAKRRSPGGLSRKTITMLTSAGVLIPGLVLIVAALKHPRHAHKDVPGEATASVVAPPPPPPPKPVGCSVVEPARRLAEEVYLAVPTLIAPAPDGQLGAVGLAATKEHALGLTVDPASLAVNTVFEQTVTGSVTVGVVPLVRSGVLEFAVDRADANLPAARTIDAEKRFTLAAGTDALSRVIGAATDVVWPRTGKGAITTPRVASVAGTGHAVVVRDGGQEGTVLAGWLTEEGGKLTELLPVKANAALVGTPTVAASAQNVLVAFAAKTAASDPWHVELAAAKTPAVPVEARAFALPPSGPGGEAISPAIETLSDGRFLLQWTEGSAGNRAVRAQTLSAELEPVGEPVTLSAADQNAGQGALWVKGNQALALFLVQKDAAHELWGASLRCP